MYGKLIHILHVSLCYLPPFRFASQLTAAMRHRFEKKKTGRKKGCAQENCT